MVSMESIIDMHVHSAPDIRQRAYTDFQLLEAGVSVGARAIVIKSHHGTTMNRAFLANEYNKKVHQDSNDFVMYGSVTLNDAIGGLNSIAVETGLKMGAKVIWLPTTGAANHKRAYRKSGGIVCAENNKAVPAVLEILKMIKDYDVVLGTGHVSAQETFIVVEEAKKMGIDKIVVTHPEFWVTPMSYEDQIKIVKDYDVYLERCYAQPMGGGMYKSNLEDNYEIFKKVGANNYLLSTDGGQVENPHWELAYAEYMQYFLDKGVSEKDLHIITKENARKLLSI